MEKLITPEEAAEYSGVDVKTLAVWRCKGRYNLPYYKIGRLIKYKMSDLVNWVEQRTVGAV